MAGLEVRSFIPGFDCAEYFPDLDLGEYVPDFAVKEHATALDFELFSFLRQKGLFVTENLHISNA